MFRDRRDKVPKEIHKTFSLLTSMAPKVITKTNYYMKLTLNCRFEKGYVDSLRG